MPSRNDHSSRPPAIVIRLGWISFFTDIASEMAYPLIPLFLVGALNAPVMVLGAVEGVSEAIVSVMNGLSGWHSDRIRKRVPYIRWGYGLGAFAKLILAVSLFWPMVFLARGIDRLGKGLRTTPRDALIADVAPRPVSGRSFGFHRAMDTAGALVGVLLSALLLHFLPGQYRLIFGLAVIPGIIAIALSFVLREPTAHIEGQISNQLQPEKKSDTPHAGQSQESSPKSMPGTSERIKTGWFGLPKAYWWAFAGLSVFALANSSDTFLLLRGRNLGLTDTHLILAYALYNVTYALASYPAGIISDRFGRWRVIAAGWVIYALVYFGFAMADKSSLWGLFAVYGIYIGLTHGVGKALIADFAPADRKGMALGIFQMSIGLITMLGSLIAGILWDAVGPTAPFWFGGLVSLVAVALIPIVVMTLQRNSLKPRTLF